MPALYGRGARGRRCSARSWTRCSRSTRQTCRRATGPRRTSHHDKAIATDRAFYSTVITPKRSMKNLLGAGLCITTMFAMNVRDVWKGSPDFSRLTMLIVDDDLDSRQFLCEVLRACGATVLDTDNVA